MTDFRTDSWSSLAPFLPWTDGSGMPWRGWRMLLSSIPFVIVYIVCAWILFVPAAERRGNLWWIDDDAIEHLLIRIPMLTEDPLRAARAIVTSPWINHDSMQLVYVTALLILFGAILEIREGTLRIVIIFFGTSMFGAVAAGALLHLIYPEIWDTRTLEVAWTRNWTGGSAGCFGILGAVAARARKPIPLLALFLAWEGIVWWTILWNYTPAFHLSALAAGCVVTRWFLPPVRRDGSSLAPITD